MFAYTVKVSLFIPIERNLWLRYLIKKISKRKFLTTGKFVWMTRAQNPSSVPTLLLYLGGCRGSGKGANLSLPSVLSILNVWTQVL